MDLFIETITNLAHSQGFYGRLLESINNMDEEDYDNLTEWVENQDFQDSLDIVLALEG